MDVLNKYNQTNLQSTFSITLRQVDPATPDAAEPSKKMFLIILSGVISFVFCVVVLFGIFFFDDAIKTPADLVNRTKLPLLGYLNIIEGTVDFKKLWDVENRDRMKIFKELVRSIRFEIDRELNGKKVIGITSLEPGEGKTLFINQLGVFLLYDQQKGIVD